MKKKFLKRAKHWEVNCLNAQYNNEELLINVVKASVFYGLVKLNDINPGLVKRFLKKKSRIKYFSCHKLLKKINGREDYAAYIMRKSDLRWYSVHFKKKYVHDFFKFSKAPFGESLSFEQSFDLLKKIEALGDEEKKEKPHLPSSLFHEYLHSQNLDNMSNEYHSSVKSQGDAMYDGDHVYTCDIAVYGMWNKWNLLPDDVDYAKEHCALIE